ncbi:DNA polymerase subunit beta [Parabacteroides sp. An277]|uniref:nucleotidyltransferase domain-containing protein n=1 Tax=Parabacteroides sp. An277 TaxID=1965619 RepID=UPI000B397838|nr:nucleotidyltransferase domain-containing protein [Parabacteroides sp. An277]OUO52410.1 DNA polymerase subunit beta [Parabacteroides sp. An277]
MRLTKHEIEQIIRVAKEIYGESVRVYLFGSRTDDTKRGGDIDLLVRTSSEKKGVLARIRMIARLKYVLGDQKIDVIGDHEESWVVNEALATGIRLA